MRRWWIFALLPVGAGVGLLTSHLGLPDWVVSIVVVVLLVLVIGIMQWRSRKYVQRMRAAMATAAQIELTGELLDLPVYLTSDMWDLAVKRGLVSAETLAAIRKKQDERRAAQRAEEES